MESHEYFALRTEGLRPDWHFSNLQSIDFKKIFTKKDENSDNVLFGKSIHCHDSLACDCTANKGSELFITFLDLI